MNVCWSPAPKRGANRLEKGPEGPLIWHRSNIQTDVCHSSLPRRPRTSTLTVGQGLATSTTIGIDFWHAVEFSRSGRASLEAVRPVRRQPLKVICSALPCQIAFCGLTGLADRPARPSGRRGAQSSYRGFALRDRPASGDPLCCPFLPFGRRGETLRSGPGPRQIPWIPGVSCPAVRALTCDDALAAGRVERRRAVGHAGARSATARVRLPRRRTAHLPCSSWSAATASRPGR